MDKAPAPLALAHWSRAEAQARSRIARELQALSFPWGPRPWQLGLCPQPDPGPLRADAGQCWLRARWGGAPFELVLPAVAAEAWVAGSFGQIDVPALPPAVLATLLEHAALWLLEGLGGLGRGEARLQGVQRGPAQGEALAHVFELRAECGKQRVRGLLATDSLGLALVASVLPPQAGLRNELPVDTLALRLRAELGFTWLPADQLRTLAVGDAVMVEQVFLTPDGELWLGERGWGLQVYWSGTALTVTREFGRGGQSMPEHEDDMPRPALDLDQLDAVPLRLSFDLGERSVTLGELRQLQVGESIELGRPLSTAVNLRVHGALVGIGELVEIDGRLGVTIRELARAGSLPMPPERLHTLAGEIDEDDEELDPE